MNTIKSLLTICIPTYNREDILDEGLHLLVEQVRNLDIKILVVDNASTDNTPNICDKYKKNIIYIRNSENIGADLNILKSYTLASEFSDYICVLGDSYRFNFNLKDLMNNLEPRFLNLAILSRTNKTISFPSGLYADKDEVLEKFGGFMDLTGCIIIKSEAVQKSNYEQYTWGNFIHFGMTFNYLASLDKIQCYYFNEYKISHTNLNKISTSWYSKLFEIFTKNWMLTILSLPGYRNESKLICIRKHDEYTRCFSIRNLCFNRINGVLTYSNIKGYKKFIPFATQTRYSIIHIISRTPISLLKLCVNMYRRIKHICSTNNSI